MTQKTFSVSESKRLAGLVPPVKKDCYRNSVLVLSVFPNLTYVEGYAVVEVGDVRLVIEHGWLESETDVIDTTLADSPAVAYFGAARFDWQAIADKFEESGQVTLPLVRLFWRDERFVEARKQADLFAYGQE